MSIKASIQLLIYPGLCHVTSRHSVVSPSYRPIMSSSSYNAANVTRTAWLSSVVFASVLTCVQNALYSSSPVNNNNNNNNTTIYKAP